MASSIFSGIADAIDGGPKLNRVQVSPELEAALNALTAAQGARQSADQSDIAALSEASRRAAAAVERLTPEDQALITQLIQTRVDPFQTYQQVGNYNKGLLDNLAANLAEQGRAGESSRMAALGYGGRGGGTYASNSLIDRVTRNLAPVYASTIGLTGRDATAIDTGRRDQNNQVLQQVATRAAVPTRSLPLYTVPTQARAAVTAAEVADLLGLGDAYLKNTAGFREKKTALGSVAGSLDSVVDTGLDFYSLGQAGGGGGGGGFGGFSQIFGGQKAPPNTYQTPWMSYYQPPTRN